jgi:toxin ParE1/3/4
MLLYEFTEHAENDLDGVTDFSVKRWGKQQAEKYINELEDLAQTLSENPDLGMNRECLFDGLISFPYVSHILYYVKQSHGITIVRILHQRMDPKKKITSTHVEFG